MAASTNAVRLLALLGAATLASACGAAARRPTATARAIPEGRAPESDLLVDDAWDLRLKVDPATTRIRTTPDELTVESLRHGRLDAGVYALSIRRAPELASRGSLELATSGAEDWRRQRHARTFAPEPVSFLGLPGHATVVQAAHAYALEVWAVSGRCVYNLVVLRAAEASEGMTRYAESFLAGLTTASGGPARAPRCK